jgi:hypothetical protein
MLGVPALPWGDDAKVFGHQTLRENVALLDEELLQQINARIQPAGQTQAQGPWQRRGHAVLGFLHCHIRHPDQRDERFAKAAVDLNLNGIGVNAVDGGGANLGKHGWSLTKAGRPWQNQNAPGRPAAA